MNTISGSKTLIPSRSTDRFSWLWLIVGGALLPFIGFQTTMPLAAWLAPIFIIRFARTQRTAVALPVVALVSAAAGAVAGRGFFDSLALNLINPLMGAAVGLLTYGMDRLLAPRLSGLARTGRCQRVEKIAIEGRVTMQRLSRLLLCSLVFVTQASSAGVDRKAILEKVHKNLTPESYEMYRKLINIEPDGSRKEFVLYTAKQGRDSMVGLFLEPPTDAGRTTLRLGDNMWLYIPDVGRPIPACPVNPVSLSGQYCFAPATS